MQQLHLKAGRSAVLASLAVLAILLVGCTRSRSTDVAPAETPGASVDATFQAILAATQTAEAQAPPDTGGGDELTATPLPPTPLPAVPSDTPAAPTPLPVQPSATPVPAAAGPRTYTVKQGDWLYKIAREQGVEPQALIAANPGINPNLLQPGQVLNIPAPGSPPPAGGPTTYTVQSGEWIYQIARKLGKDPNAIIAANPGINPHLLYPGQVINIP
jgi:LysM repeat protein